MTINFDNLELTLFDLIDQMKVLVSPATWENILLNCTKNEMLVLMLIYRNTEVNMSQIADYIGVPLNTATGIVSRMEKKDMVVRVRSAEDKRVVLIALTAAGQVQIKSMLEAAMSYGQKVLTTLTLDEMTLIGSIIEKVLKVMEDERQKETRPSKEVRKITID